MIDNFDSFTNILVDYVRRCDEEIIMLNHFATISEILYHKPKRIILSPGPSIPKLNGNLMDIIDKFHHKLPILGVCLGHQALGEYFGMTLTHANKIMHGKTSVIMHNEQDVFHNITNPLTVMRYHSFLLSHQIIPNCISLTAKTSDNEIMAIRHKTLPIHSVQFHPESILTQRGIEIVKNWLILTKN